MTALDNQVGGNHYKNLKIQPIEYIHANNIELLIELETKEMLNELLKDW